MASVVPFPALPSESAAEGPNTLGERLSGLLTCETDEFLSAGARSRLFARLMRGWCYYVPDMKQWAVWDAQTNRWNMGEPETTALPLMEVFLERLMEVSVERRVAVVTGESGLMSNRALYDLLRRIKHHQELHKPSIEWDSNPYLLGVANGVVDLRDGRLYVSPRGAFVTMHTDVAYHSKRVHSHHWDKLLMDITREDQMLRQFLRNWFGSLLTGANPRERFTILYGPGGTGKGTMMSAVMGALGPYAMVIPAETICKKYGGGGSAREDLADMQGRRLVVCLELTNESELDPTLIKTLTGQDTLRARALYEKGRHIRPTWSLVGCCNVWPRLSSEPDSGWWRRMLAIPFLYRPDEPDMLLKSRLLDDPKERESILSWLIAGSVAYYRHYQDVKHWQPPDAVLRAIGRYRIQYDHLSYWIEQCVRRGTDEDRVPNHEVFASYLDWAETHEMWPEDTVDSRQVGRALSREGYMRGRFRGPGGAVVRGWSGFRLVDPSTPPETNWEEEAVAIALTDFEV